MDSQPAVNGIMTPKRPLFYQRQERPVQGEKPLTAEQIVEFTKSLFADRFKLGQPFNSPDIGREWLRLECQDLKHEIFACLFLDGENCLIAHEALFRGTVNAARIYPREVAKRVLQLNAAAVIFANNRPSGNPVAAGRDNSLHALFLDSHDKRITVIPLIAGRGARTGRRELQQGFRIAPCRPSRTCVGAGNGAVDQNVLQTRVLATTLI